MTYVMQGYSCSMSMERIGQIDTGGSSSSLGWSCRMQMTRRRDGKKFFAAGQRRPIRSCKNFRRQSDMTPAEIIKTLQTAPGQGATPKRGAVGPGDMYAAGQADAKQLVGRPARSPTSDQAPSEAEKERFYFSRMRSGRQKRKRTRTVQLGSPLNAIQQVIACEQISRDHESNLAKRSACAWEDSTKIIRRAPRRADDETGQNAR